MPAVARPYAPEDADSYFAIISATYGNGVPTPEENRTMTAGRPFVAEIKGRVAGVAKINDYVCTRGAAELPSAGIAGVAVSPSERQSGVGSTLLEWMVRHAREEGFAVSSLYAFRDSFYRKFGYETVGKRIAIKCPTGRLPKLRSDLPVQNLVPEDRELIRPCYEAFARARSGFHIRDERRWNEVLNARDFPKTYVFGDPVEAYAIVAHKIDFWDSQKVAEVVWTTEAGHRAVVAWFGGLGANKTHIEWSEPSDSPFLARYNDQGVESKLAQPIMYRVLNTPEALKSLRTDESGEFNIHIVDKLLPENQGPWRVAFSPDGVIVEKASAADVTMDIRQFTCAFMGDPSVVDLARNGLIEVRDRAALKSISRLLTPSPVSCWDFF
jgi:predicted acetyltransferase